MKIKKKKDPKLTIETCRRCRTKAPRSEMYHIQLGFEAAWYCKDRTACHLRE